jgi:hypothetical protein
MSLEGTTNAQLNRSRLHHRTASGAIVGFSVSTLNESQLPCDARLRRKNKQIVTQQPRAGAQPTRQR